LESKTTLENAVPGTFVPFQMNMLYFMFGITNPSLWWDLTYENTYVIVKKKG
jgi:hypothetical protein